MPTSFSNSLESHLESPNAPQSPIELLEQQAEARRLRFRGLVERFCDTEGGALFAAFSDFHATDPDLRPQDSPIFKELALACGRIAVIAHFHNCAVQSAIEESNGKSAIAWAYDEGRLCALIQQIESLATTI